MVKNLPSVERSTKIRFGKHVPDSNDQEENTIVFNASNVTVPTPYSNAVYLSPIRNRSDFSAPEVVLLMYDRNTKEITESGESANALVGGVTFTLAVDRANVTSNTIQFTGGGHDDNNVAFVTDSNVGISNLLPQHTVSVGSNLYIDEFGSNVLVVSGNVAVLRDMVIDGNLRVNGDTTVIYAENTAIKDALIELGQNNTSEDTTLDLGLLMHRPSSSSNVVIGYREGLDEFAISYTESNPNEKVFIPKTDEDINVHVYGLTHVDANIYAHEDLHVSGNTHVTGTGTSTIPSLNVYRATSSTSRTTGALIVGGGLGVGGDIHATHANLEDVEADSVNITDTTASSSKTTGALRVAGGLGVAGDIHATHANLEDVEADSVNITDATATTSKTTGALRVAGGLGVAGDIHATHANLEDVEADSINITDTTASSSKTTGALKVAGGAGIQGDLYAADTTLDSVKALNLATGTLPFTDSTKKLVDSLITQNDDGSIIISANVEIAGNISVVGNTFAITSNDVVITDRIFDIANNNTSTSLDIGILMEHPGKNIFIGHHTNPQDNFTIGYTSNGYTEDHVEWNGTDHITANVWGYLITQNTVTIEHNDLYVKNGLIGVTTESPVANIHVVGNAFVTSNITTSSNIIVGGTAAATSKTTGALQVAGGLGVAGDIHGSSLYTDDYLIHSGDTDTKIGFPLADTFTVTTANTERLRVNATGAILSTDTSGSAANPELSLYRDQTGSNGNYLGQIRFDGKHDGGNDQLYAKITGKIKKADQGGEDGVIETAIITDGSQRISLRHTGDLFHIKKGTDFQVGETANIYVKTSTSRVGINTDSPAYSLDVQGTSNVGVFTSTDGTITNATASTSKTTGALKVVGGLGVVGDIHATHANLEDVEADSVNITDTTASSSKTTGALKVAGGLGVAGDIYTTSVYAGHNTDQASYFGRGAIGFSGDTNHASFSHIDNNTSANYAIKQTEGGTTHLNTKSGQHIRFNVNNSEKMRLTGAGDLKVGSNILYVDVSESAIGVNTNSPAYSLDVQGTSNVGVFTSTGGTITDTTASSSKTTGALKVAGGLGVAGDIHATHANLEDVEADSVNITDTTASSSKTTGALKVAGGLGVAGALYGGAATFDDLTVDGTTLTVDTSNDRVGVKTGSPAYTLDINGDLNFAGSLYQGGSAFVSTPWTMETSPTALSYTAGNVGIGAANPAYKLEVDGDINIKSGHNLRIAGNIPVFSNWTVSGSNINRATGNVGIATATPNTKLHVHGGTIINSDGVAKKTYSYSGDLTSGQTVANSTIKITFSAHVFYAKIVAHLVESDNEVSTFSLECGGGNWSGGTPLAIAKGPQAIFGSASTNPWSSTVTTSATTVSIKPTTNMAVAGHYNIFIEYISQHSSGVVSKITEGATDVVTFGY
ncbi:hypothetical protein OLVG_00183 [Ostreococcus lucimarinus virus OlV6]|nr:hypothetical protein OLVG_00183 [Ostreococcus lucimarinus virus OlV6]